MEPLAIMSVCSALNIVNLCIFLLCVWLFVYFVCVDMDPPGSEIKNYIKTSVRQNAANIHVTQSLRLCGKIS